MIPPIQKIAVPIDFSPFSKEAVSYAAILAKYFNAAMVLINVVDLLGFYSIRRFSNGTIGFNLQRFKKERSSEQMERLQCIAAELQQEGLQTEAHVLVDVPFRGVLKCMARSKCDFLVLVTKGRTDKTDVLVGSCAEKLFRRSPVPVLSIPAAFIPTHGDKTG